MLISSIIELRKRRKFRCRETRFKNVSGVLNLSNSSLYQEFKAEKEEILKYKYTESKKLGYDIEYERALLEWIYHYRDEWRDARRNNSKF